MYVEILKVTRSLSLSFAGAKLFTLESKLQFYFKTYPLIIRCLYYYLVYKILKILF